MFMGIGVERGRLVPLVRVRVRVGAVRLPRNKPTQGKSSSQQAHPRSSGPGCERLKL